MTEGDLTLDDEYTMQYTGDVLQNYTLEIYITLLTNVTPVDVIELKKSNAYVLL